jgi:predicted alpha-1,2-mannosidase
MHKLLLLLLPLQIFAQKDFTKYVDPFIGTGGHGHTFPGPTLPFGMVQLSPDTRLHGWDGCSGYHYSDKKIYGFSHTHLSGTGCSDYGDILLMPTTGKVKWSNKKYSSCFKKENEKAKVGYYSVFLDKPKVKVELTATTRTGLHKYTFPKSSSANIIIDLTHRDRVKQGEVNIVGNNEINGMRLSTEWANNQYVYFVVQFSKPFKKAVIAKADVAEINSTHDTGCLLKAAATFETTEGEVIYAKVGISAVSVEGARANLNAEQPAFDFEKTVADAAAAWNKELGKIDAESKDEKLLRTFYTALYHAMTPPNIYNDVDGKYRGRDLQIHETKNFNYYTVFSLWDTYRALHPLLTLIDRKRTGDFVNTFVTEYEQNGLLPVWELSSCETFCMIGYHSVPVIADAYLKGITSFDANKAFEAMKHSAAQSKSELNSYKRPGPFLDEISFFRYAVGWDDYQKFGYIKNGLVRESVSKTLEFAFDDWTIAQMAKKLGKTDDYNTYIKRAQNYKNVFDTETGFMRPRDDKFMSPFDPYKVDHNYTEGNAWQYSFYVPQDISGWMKLLGGKEKLAEKLDSLFTTTSKLTGHKQPDISGLIGQYAHGNEPSHQIAYEYDYAGQAWKTQAMARRIMSEMYHAEPDGLSGNEDCGQMSAWYVFSALGFYPVCPGSDHYAIGSPVLDKATIHFENGKSFTVTAGNNQKENVYISSAKMNGTNYTKSYVKYDDLLNGGELNFEMSAQPNKNWGCGENDVPVTRIEN